MLTPENSPNISYRLSATAPLVATQRLAASSKLLPRLPARVAVIEAMEAKPAVAKVLSRLDAFVVKDSAVVYVVRQSSLLKGAVKGSLVHVHALATVIWHEMAHVAGADEGEARRQEQALWTTFVRDQTVDGR